MGPLTTNQETQGAMMAKSGRERKANRRARKETEARGAGAKHNLPKRGAAQMEHRAITQRWPMPEATKAHVIERITKDALNIRASRRERAAAARVLVQAEKQNQIDQLAKAQLAARVDMGATTLAAFENAAAAQIILVAPDNGRGPNRRIDSP